jgi:hypothetical protein
VKMNGLRVYFNPQGTTRHSDSEAFYSRRADGPFYRWFYEGESGEWRFSRVHLSRPNRKMLCLARWRAVPLTLKARLDEHYLE